MLDSFADDYEESHKHGVIMDSSDFLAPLPTQVETRLSVIRLDSLKFASCNEITFFYRTLLVSFLSYRFTAASTGVARA